MLTTRTWLGRPTALLVVLVAVAGLSCSTPNEVVFEGTPDSAASRTSSTARTATTRPAPQPTTSITTSPSATTTPGSALPTPAGGTSIPVSSLAVSDRPIDRLPGQVAISDPSGGSITILGPGTEQVSQFTAPGEQLHQPTWSPDGSLLAWSHATREGFSVVVSSPDGDRATYETPFGVFYLQWRPEGGAIGLLGASEAGQVTLAILDLETGLVTPLNSAPSYYFHWSPEGDRMITHLGGNHLELLDPGTGASSLLRRLDQITSAFQAAVWTPDGESILYVRPASPDQAGAGDELVIHHLETGETDPLAQGTGFFNFAVSPDGLTVAYSIRDPSAGTSMAIVDLATGRTRPIDAPATMAWQWSPDSRKILLLGVGDQAMTVKVYESGRITQFQDIIPAATFVQNYLLFWSQYDLSHSLWAPDSSAFVFAAFERNTDRVFLQPLATTRPVLLGPGSMAVFSPAASGPDDGTNLEP